MTDSISLDDFDSERPAKDYRRANGAPMVLAPDGSGKWLRYSRPSGWGHDLDDESALVLWRIDRAMDGVAASPSLSAKVALSKGSKTGRKDLRDQAIMIGRGEEASDLGTALHAMTVRVETADGWEAPEPYAADLAAYLSTIDSAGLVSDHIEVHVCNDEYRAAGTADRIYRATRELLLPSGVRVPPGTLFIGDLKTGKTLEYSLPGYTIQLALYAQGSFYDVDTNERSPLPDGLRTDYGILMHLPASKAKCELLWVDLTIGMVGADLVQAVRAWRHREDFSAPFTMPDDDVAALMAMELGARDVAPSSPVPPTDADEWMAVMVPFAQDRIDQIGSHPEARGLLLRRWPENIPPLRVGGHTTAQITQVLDLLDTVEAAFSLPFPADPRAGQAGVHRSEMHHITNTPPNTGATDA